MNEFEGKLRNALRRQPAPEGFAEKIMARTAGLPRPGAKPERRFRALISSPMFRWAAAAVAVCLLIVGGVAHYQRQERLRQQGEMAKVQVKQALRIASVKLNVARKKVQGIGREATSSHL
jgi:hypothetical protein